jgi:hypothetical protein
MRTIILIFFRRTLQLYHSCRAGCSLFVKVTTSSKHGLVILIDCTRWIGHGISLLNLYAWIPEER